MSIETFKVRTYSGLGREACRPIRIPKAAEIVSKELRKQIVRGELPEGNFLPSEVELCQSFGFSRPILREAIRVLESEGLITVIRGAKGGAVVRRPDVKVATRYLGLLLQASGTTLAEIYHVHMLVEPASARKIARSGNSTAAAVLRQCILESRESLDDDFEFGAAAARFRNKLIELAGIPILSLLMGMLNDIFERYWASLTVAAGRNIDNVRAKRRGLRSLEKLIEFIDRRDSNGAEAHWIKHTTFVEKTIRHWLPTATVIDVLEE